LIRSITPEDVPALKMIIDATGLFPSVMLDDMLVGYFNGDASEDFWLTTNEEGLLGVACYVPKRMTQGTWNLLLIAVHPESQGQGHGSALLHHIEQALAERGARLLLVEASGLPSFERQRIFYCKYGFDEEARIRDFYQAGEDKIVFRKALANSKG
jgi:ribosomal protein S18 acetylase RimI-like enzyme